MDSPAQGIVRSALALSLALALQGVALGSSNSDEEEHHSTECGYWTVTTSKTYKMDAQNYHPIMGTRAYASAFGDAGETEGRSDTYEANAGWEAEAAANTTALRTITSIFTPTEEGCTGWAKLAKLKATVTGSIDIISGYVVVAALTELTGTCTLTSETAYVKQDQAQGTSDLSWSGSLTVLGVKITYKDYTGGTKSIGPLYGVAPQAEDCTNFVYTVCKGRVESYAKGDGWMLSPGSGTAETEGKWEVVLEYGACPPADEEDEEQPLD